ncbi:hypothetical protein ECZC10_54460 [Escherichia coli]|nr:hypothetical protein ECZC10_54460 [Escherichia coli]
MCGTDAVGVRNKESDVDYPVTIIEAEGFLKLIPTSAVVLNQPFGLFFSAGIVLIPVIFECVRAPPVPAGKDGCIIRIVMLGVACHRLSPVTRRYSATVQVEGIL